MAFTVEQLTAVEAALASGELKVKYDGKEVEYRSVNQLMRVRDAMLADLTAAGLIADNSKKPSRTTLAEFLR